MSGRRWMLAVLVLGLLAGVFYAGTRYPFAFLDRWLAPRQGSGFWSPRHAGPLPRYEASAAAVNGKLLVFGGFFGESPPKATPRVDAYDPSSDRWVQLHDMPLAVTHRNAAVVGGSVWFAGGFVGNSPGAPTAAVWRYDTADDSWHSGSPLPEARGGGFLGALDGSLHFVGGYLPDRDTPASEHWVIPVDSAIKGVAAWKPAAPLPVARGHVAGAVLDGYLYLMGGVSHHDPVQLDLNPVERYDPRTNRWEELAPLPMERSHFEPGTIVADGRIIIIGGRSYPRGIANVADVTMYDPAENRWVALPPLPGGRLAPVAGRIGDSIIAGFGGSIGNDVMSDEFWAAPLGRHWERGPDLPEALGEVATAVVGTRLLVLGEGSGYTLSLDLGRGRWDPPQARARRANIGNHYAAEVIGDSLYLLGGLGGFGWAPGHVQVYDVVRDEWSFGPPMPFAAGSSASAAIRGRIYVAGGIVGDTTTRLGARLDPATNTWSPIAPMPRPRNHAASATDGERLYVFGGRGPGSGNDNSVANGFADVQIYDPPTDRWTVSGEGPGAPLPLPQGRGGMGKAVYLNGEFYVIGGETRDGPGATPNHVYTRVDIYDPKRNLWRSGPEMPTGRHGIFPVVVAGRIYIAGGGTRAGQSQSSVLEVLAVPRPPR